MDIELLRSLATPASSKILLCVVDGLGGMADVETRRTELQSADVVNLDRLAQDSINGMSMPVGYGITPGSGPGHLALFGYDPLRFEVGRGVLEALGIDFDLQKSDLAARGNFCTVDDNGLIVDRRAGRLPTAEMLPVAELLKEIKVPGVEVIIEPVVDYRFVLILRGEGLDDGLTQTDPEREHVPPVDVRATRPESQRAADLVNEFIAKAREKLRGQPKANSILLRGFAKYPDLPPLPEVTQMRAGAFAVYPMYRGLAKLVGMTVAPGGGTPQSQLDSMKARWDDFDFFFYHFKKADAAGEDGNYRAKVQALEEFDSLVPQLRELGADVMMVAGDHSTPSQLASHSWHPVPFLIWSKDSVGDENDEFSEPACRRGSLGVFPAKEALSMAMASAGRLMKFGA